MKLLKLFTLSLILISSIACKSKYNLYSGDLAETKARPVLTAAHDDYEKTEIKDRKVLFTANLDLRVDHPDTANVALEQLANNFGGYVQELGTYRTVIRVKSNTLDEAIEQIGKIGKVLNKEIIGSDVTVSYQDAGIRLENAQKARNRYLELLKKAETVDEILKVEKELERLNTELDLLRGRINRIDHLEAFSTININLKERKKPGILGYIGLGLYHSVKWLFVRN